MNIYPYILGIRASAKGSLPDEYVNIPVEVYDSCYCDVIEVYSESNEIEFIWQDSGWTPNSYKELEESYRRVKRAMIDNLGIELSESFKIVEVEFSLGIPRYNSPEVLSDLVHKVASKYNFYVKPFVYYWDGVYEIRLRNEENTLTVEGDVLKFYTEVWKEIYE